MGNRTFQVVFSEEIYKRPTDIWHNGQHTYCWPLSQTKATIRYQTDCHENYIQIKKSMRTTVRKYVEERLVHANCWWESELVHPV